MYSMIDDVHMRKCKYAFCIYEMRDYPEQSRAFYHNTECISIAVQHNSANNTRSQASIWSLSKVHSFCKSRSCPVFFHPCPLWWRVTTPVADIETCRTSLCLKSCHSTCSFHLALYKAASPHTVSTKGKVKNFFFFFWLRRRKKIISGGWGGPPELKHVSFNFFIFILHLPLRWIYADVDRHRYT